MKKSEELMIQANQAEDNFKYMALYSKSIRQKRLENFEDNYSYRLIEKNCLVKQYDGQKVVINTQTEEWGIVDFFPMADKVLIRKENAWRTGFNWLDKYILK